MQAPVTGFRCRAALRETVTNAALRYLSQNGGGSVVIFAVMGGYEARTPERGVPSGSHTQLEIVTAPPAEPPVPPAVPPASEPATEPARESGVEEAAVEAQQPGSPVVPGGPSEPVVPAAPPIVPGKPAKRGKAT